MTSFEGLFDLKTPRDLAAKARHDYTRFCTNTLSTYAAFDFFVAARHIPHWLYPDDSTRQQSIFDRHIEFRIARHIADGGKHFRVTHPRHKQVLSTSRTTPAFAPGVFENFFHSGELTIQLDPRDPDTAMLGEEISVLKLASRLVELIEALVTS